MCMERPDQGPCSESLVRYYYDATYGACNQFYYGGCLGNANRFETLEECQTYCGWRNEISSGKIASLTMLYKKYMIYIIVGWSTLI